MKKINQIMSAEMERQNKMGVAGKKGLRVNHFETSPTPSDPTQVHLGQASQSESGKSQKKEIKLNSLVTALEAVQSNLVSLKEAFDKSQTPAEKSTTQRYEQVGQSRLQRRQCNACYSAGVDRCDHCFKCGSNEHFARGCRKGYGSGNERRLHPRDRV